MFFGYYITTAGFFYCAVRRFITRKVAFFSVVFLATSTFLIGAYSTTLANGPAVVYDAMCLYFIAVAMTSTNRTKARLALLASGFSAGLAVHCHLVIVPYLAANLVIYGTWQLFLAPGKTLKRVTDFALGSLLVLLGILVVTAILGAIIALVFHGSFSQILNDFAYVPAAERNLAQFHNADWYESGAEAGMLLTACLIATLNIFAMRVGAGPTDRELANRILAISVGVLALSAALLIDNQRGGVFLQYSSYFTCFVPYLAMLIFSLLAVTPIFERRHIVALAAAFCVASLLIAMIRENAAPWLYDPNAQARAAIICGVCTAGLFLLVIARKFGTRHTTFALLTIYMFSVLALSLISRPEEKVGSWIWIHSREVEATQRGEYVRLERGLTFLTAQNFEKYPKFWVDMSRIPETGIYPRAFMTYRYQPYFPGIDNVFCYDVRLCQFNLGDNIVVISDSRDLSARAQNAFTARGLRVKESANTLVSYEGLSYELLVEHVIGKADAH